MLIEITYFSTTDPFYAEPRTVLKKAIHEDTIQSIDPVTDDASLCKLTLRAQQSMGPRTPDVLTLNEGYEAFLTRYQNVVRVVA